ncbi:MAG: glycerol-3-phosphate 1-O-acyltransferase PlsY [Clostridiales Family XIII bacterium]|jgi:glycerol-3-phosphate acyltransferase PlsY|nr:glycerol-3-phosphate 1-O-acyltransferase PlsY [Clostridiales Family XIII bacterium]
MTESLEALGREVAALADAGAPLAVSCLVAAYFIGTISPAILLGRMKGVDIREKGSGNAGTTNVLRTLGRKAAAITLAIDVLKGSAAVLLAGLAGGGALSVFCGFAALCGHIWPAPYGFRGGKGVATGLGVILAFDPAIGLISLGIALAVIALTRRVSAGALTAVTIFPALMHAAQPAYTLPAIAIAALLWIKHRHNVARIIRGQEPKLSFGRK